MSDVKFTPGPWEACDPGDYGDFDGESRVVLGNDMRIAVVHWHEGDYRAENDANANLIAASPGLYDALQKLRIALDLIDPSRPLAYAATMSLMRNCADAALAKARGEA